jgi:hypothetical protein
MSALLTQSSIKPIILVPTGEMTAENLKLLNDNGICTVECKNPALVKFLDPIPSSAQRGKIEQAAIQLFRKLIGVQDQTLYRSTIIEWYVKALAEGSSLQQGPTQEEQEAKMFADEKRWELQRLAREEAKAERAAIKAAKKAEDEAKAKAKEKSSKT